MAKPSAPKTPSVTETAGAQTASNVSTAIANQQLNAINQQGPNGSVEYSQAGTYSFTDPSTGKVYQLPKLTQTTTLSPGQQAIYDAMTGAQGNLANTAKTQSARLDGLLSEPFSLDNDATEARLMELASKRLNPQLDRRREQEAVRLRGQGIMPGSTAYDEAMRQVNEGENDAVNQLLLTGRNQAVQEALLERSQPLNEIIGLASGTQVQTPQAMAAPQTGMAGTDVAGITQQNYANQMAGYNSQMGQWNSGIGGLFSLGGSALQAAGSAGGFAPLFAGMFSDERLKTDIKATGDEVAGVPVKSWKWRGSGEPDVGVIAQDVEKKHPEMVDRSHPSGYRRVNYGGLMRLGTTAKMARAA